MKRVLISLALIAALSGAFALGRSQTQPTVQTTYTAPTEEITVGELYNEVNKVHPLLLDPALNSSAEAKCQDMVSKNYFNHNAPDGTEPWVFFPDRDWLGENLAEGFVDEVELVDAWQASPTHNENLINPHYNKVGYGVCDGGSLVVQHFSD